jgi:hypothetical protein
MILGRSPNTWIGAVLGLINVVVLFHLGNFAPSLEQVAGLNAFVGLAVGLIANNTNSQVASANAAIARDSVPPSNGTPGSVGESTSSSTGTSSSQASSSSSKK